MFVYPQISFVKILTINVLVLGEAFGRKLDHDHGAIMSGIKCPYQRDPLYTVHMGGSNPEKGSHQNLTMLSP